MHAPYFRLRAFAKREAGSPAPCPSRLVALGYAKVATRSPKTRSRRAKSSSVGATW